MGILFWSQLDQLFWWALDWKANEATTSEQSTAKLIWVVVAELSTEEDNCLLSGVMQVVVPPDLLTHVVKLMQEARPGVLQGQVYYLVQIKVLQQISAEYWWSV